MNLPGDYLWCFGTAALLSALSCSALGLIWRRRLEALKKELSRLSEDLLQMVELQMDTYHHVRRSVTDLEEKIIELSLPSSDVPLPLERRHQVLTLARKGVAVDEIAHRLNMPKGEAELILNLRRYANFKGTPEHRNVGLQEHHAPLSS
ncbi:MAG: hypothetical protein H6Q05_2425 [Acidobacteria bacterium]|nr:hypothetical protein [Acidobacteriota bacterium]